MDSVISEILALYRAVSGSGVRFFHQSTRSGLPGSSPLQKTLKNEDTPPKWILRFATAVMTVPLKMRIRRLLGSFINSLVGS